jgi:mannose-1-phosphate guanylyltransferase
MLHAVVMAGGSGTRFWPESRADRPKQLLRLAGRRTMLQETVERLAGFVAPEQLLVITSAKLVKSIREQLPNLSSGSILGEPCKRDTAAAIGLAALHVSRTDPDATLAVMPSDHVISPAKTFQHTLNLAARLVDEQPDRLVTFGIPPTYPAESFGYIERGQPVSDPGVSARVFRVAKFREKPPASVAREYLASGNFYWNSGIFVWKARTILRHLAQRQPEMMSHLERIVAASDSPDFQGVFEREFSSIRGVSIDYAVMEHAKDVLVVEADFAWDDVGSWQAIARLRGSDSDGNTVEAKHIGVSTEGSIIRGLDDHLIVTMGIRDCLVVHTPDATLVANRQDEESIRQVVKLLEERGWREYL